MKKYPFVLLISTLILCAIQCKQEMPAVDNYPTQHETLLIKYPGKVLLDQRLDYLYVLDHHDRTIKNYNYADYESRNQSAELPSSTLNDYQLALGTYHGAPEVYVGVNHTILILDGITLKLKDSISIEEESEDRAINTIQSAANNLIIVGTSNRSSPLIGKSFVVNRATKEKISQRTYDQNMKFESYVDVEDNNIHVIGAGPNLYPSLLVLDKYNSNGESLEQLVVDTSDFAASHLIKTKDNLDYFVSSSLGNIFAKKDLSFRFSLYGAFKDLAISENGTTFYGITFDQKLEFYDYDNRTVFKTIELEHPAEYIFLDEEELIVVYFGSFHFGERKVFISKIPI